MAVLTPPPDCQFVHDLCDATAITRQWPLGEVTRRWAVCVSPLGVLAAKSAHGVTRVATFILLAHMGNQGDQRVFRVNGNVSRFPLNFKTDRKLHLRALPISAKCSTLQEAGVLLSFLIGAAGCTKDLPRARHMSAPVLRHSGTT